MHDYHKRNKASKFLAAFNNLIINTGPGIGKQLTVLGVFASVATVDDKFVIKKHIALRDELSGDVQLLQDDEYTIDPDHPLGVDFVTKMAERFGISDDDIRKLIDTHELHDSIV